MTDRARLGMFLRRRGLDFLAHQAKKENQE
jgi:hypothetical protein